MLIKVIFLFNLLFTIRYLKKNGGNLHVIRLIYIESYNCFTIHTNKSLINKKKTMCC